MATIICHGSAGIAPRRVFNRDHCARFTAGVAIGAHRWAPSYFARRPAVGSNRRITGNTNSNKKIFCCFRLQLLCRQMITALNDCGRVFLHPFVHILFNCTLSFPSNCPSNLKQDFVHRQYDQSSFISTGRMGEVIRGVKAIWINTRHPGMSSRCTIAV